MKASENKWLLVDDGVVLTEIIEPVICLLDPWFERFKIIGHVSSGLRTAEHQLQIIKKKALNHRLFKKEWLDTIGLEDTDAWEEVWSQVLRMGDIVNPPFPARNRYEYIRDGTTMPIGRLIGQSPHQRGTAFDIRGENNLQTRVVIIDAALKSGEVPGLKGYLREIVNNAVHCDCRETKIEQLIT